MSKFAATYYINRYEDGDKGFAHELLDLQTMFDNVYEESAIVDEWTDTYYEVISFIKDKPEGKYSIFIIGNIVYSQDYWGESDVDVEIEYHNVEEFVQAMFEHD